MTLPHAQSSLCEWPRAVRKLRNLDTTVHLDPELEGLRYGQVMWATNIHNTLAGIAWDWREVRNDVVAICDPMAVQSNVKLIGDQGEPISESQLLLFLNRAIHSLPWQHHIVALWRPRALLKAA